LRGNAVFETQGFLMRQSRNSRSINGAQVFVGVETGENKIAQSIRDAGGRNMRAWRAALFV
jgi:hypothetical protein